MLNFLCNLCGFLQQDLLARFCKESSLAKQEMLPDIGARTFLTRAAALRYGPI